MTVLMVTLASYLHEKGGVLACIFDTRVRILTSDGEDVMRLGSNNDILKTPPRAAVCTFYKNSINKLNQRDPNE